MGLEIKKIMDILTDILDIAGLKKRVLHSWSFSEGWSFTCSCPKSFGFHIITQGTAYLWREDKKESIKLNKGDIVFMTKGMIHHITSNPDIKLIDKKTNICKSSESYEQINKDIFTKACESNKPVLTLVSGTYKLWNEPIHYLFNDLPNWNIIRKNSIDKSESLQTFLNILYSELDCKNIGSDNIIASILDIIFNLILRKIVETSIPKYKITNAIKDPVINKALQLMHSKPDRNWTVELLAEEVGLSRSGFSIKFKQYLGSPPLTYLKSLRIFKASNFLNKTDYTLEKIAHLVGYKDVFSFSKTFKKLTGMSPKRFRTNAQFE